MESSKIDVAFVLPSLVAGGAERVISLVAKHLDRTSFNVTLIVIGFEKDKAYDVNNVNVVYFNKSRVLKGLPNLFLYVLKNKPQIMLSCMSHLNVIMALILLFFPKVKLVTREANIKKVAAEFYENKRSLISSLLLKISHKRTNAVVCQSKDMANEMLSEYKIEKQKLHIINNPISDEFKLKQIGQINQIPQYITVGRLHKEKGHERILNILSKLDYDFHYTIIGIGEEYHTIKSQAKTLKLESRITLINFTDEVHKYLSKSDLFLQGSYAEGFPNSLLESCAVGTPVVAFHSPGGTLEIVENGINGYLAQNEEEYLHFIKLLRQQPLNSETVSQSVYKKFNKDLIVNKYQVLFNLVLKQAS